MVLDILDREGGDVQMTIGGNIVRKEFRQHEQHNAVRRVSDLIKIYKLLKAKEVPYVDTLEDYKLDHARPCVYLTPVGIHTYPVSGLECFNAVTCLLKALEVRFEVSVFII